MSILDTLAQEHRGFESLLAELAATPSTEPEERRRRFSELQSGVTAHARAEEEVVYRVLRDRLPDEVQVLEGYEEHHIADVLLQELASACPGGRGWVVKVRVFEEVLRHHIKQEELMLFPLIQSACDDVERESMDAAFHAVRHQALEAAIGPLRLAMPAFAGRALVDLQAIAGRYARRGELRVRFALERRSALQRALPRSLRDRVSGLSELSRPPRP